MYIRAILYRYHFAKPDSSPGQWWTREQVGAPWLPAMSADDPRLLEYLKLSGIQP